MSQPSSGSPAGLTGPNRDAYVVLQSLLGQWNLQSLAPVVSSYLQQGYGADAISYLLQQTPQYKQRFAGNDVRIKNGLPPLSPADYLNLEGQYHQVLRQAGLPSGFYDKPADFASLIGADVSAAEVQKRATDAQQFVLNADPNARHALQSMYGIDMAHLTAYYLDPKNAMPLLEKRATAAQIGQAALDQHLQLTDRSRAESLADRGVTGAQAQQGYGQIAQFLPQELTLAHRYGVDYNQQTAENEVLGGSGLASQQRKRLNSMETAQFAGDSSAKAGASLGSQTIGNGNY